jgi:hypothetical protein
MSKYAKNVEQFYTYHCSVTSIMGEHGGTEDITEKVDHAIKGRIMNIKENFTFIRTNAIRRDKQEGDENNYTL